MDIPTKDILHHLETDLQAALTSECDQIFDRYDQGEEDASEILDDYVDRVIPVYYSQLGTLIAEKPELAMEVEIHPGESDLFAIIQRSVGNHLQGVANDWLKTALENRGAEANDQPEP